MGGDSAKGIIGKILSIYVILPILGLMIAWKLEWLNKKFFLIVLFTAFIFGANYIFHGLIITEENLPEVIEKTKASSGHFVIYGLTPQSFKNLATSFEEIKRYIQQQNDVILYYEQALTE